jgi:hypothetical protein
MIPSSVEYQVKTPRWSRKLRMEPRVPCGVESQPKRGPRKVETIPAPQRRAETTTARVLRLTKARKMKTRLHEQTVRLKKYLMEET